jgi:hypothetical protein
MMIKSIYIQEVKEKFLIICMPIIIILLVTTIASSVESNIPILFKSLDKSSVLMIQKITHNMFYVK